MTIRRKGSGTGSRPDKALVGALRTIVRDKTVPAKYRLQASRMYMVVAGYDLRKIYVPEEPEESAMEDVQPGNALDDLQKLLSKGEA